jgi:hypothetical protein
LTRQNLENAKKVGGQLRVLLQTMNPDLDIDAALLTVDGGKQVDVRTINQGRSEADMSSGRDGNGEAPLDRYEWQEGHRPTASGAPTASAASGMAILPSMNAGYLGRAFHSYTPLIY